MKRALLAIPILAVLSGCAFFEALTADPDGPTGPQKSPAAQAAEDLSHATLDYAGLAALIFTVGKTVMRTTAAMQAKKKAKASS